MQERWNETAQPEISDTIVMVGADGFAHLKDPAVQWNDR